MSARGQRGPVAAIILAVLVVLLVGAADGVVRRALGQDEEALFQDRTAMVGQPVDVHGQNLTVEKVEAAYQVARDAQGTERTSSVGMFLVVTLRGDGVGARTPSGIDVDLTYAGLTGTKRGGNTPAAGPGFSQRTTVYFDVDPGRLEGARLRLWDGSFIYGHRTRGVVDLGLDRAGVERLAATPRDRVAVVARPSTRGLR